MQLLQAIFLLSTVTSVVIAGEKRINCDGHGLPVEKPAAPGFDWSLFLTLTDFCMVTLACQCIGQKVNCTPPQDDTFYPLELRERTDLQDYCQHKCVCRDAHMRIGKSAKRKGYVGDGLRSTNGYGPSRPAPPEKRPWFSDAKTRSDLGYMVNPALCRGNCLAAEDCDARKSCGEVSCVVRKRPYSPYFGLGSCVSEFASTLGKRAELDSPCYCNSTYVSRGCCQALNGIVWEDPDARLGEYVPDMDDSEDS